MLTICRWHTCSDECSVSDTIINACLSAFQMKCSTPLPFVDKNPADLAPSCYIPSFSFTFLPISPFSFIPSGVLPIPQPRPLCLARLTRFSCRWLQGERCMCLVRVNIWHYVGNRQVLNLSSPLHTAPGLSLISGVCLVGPFSVSTLSSWLECCARGPGLTNAWAAFHSVCSAKSHCILTFIYGLPARESPFAANQNVCVFYHSECAYTVIAQWLMWSISVLYSLFSVLRFSSSSSSMP